MGSACLASMVAIFTGRTTEGAGRPAWSGTGTSPLHGRFAAEVIITTHNNAPPSPTGPSDTTRAGRLWRVSRSEEHTSELQSRGHLVCRLLLEKKKSVIT